MSLILVVGFKYAFMLFLFVPSDALKEINPRLNAWFKDCQEKTGASDSDYELIKMRKIPTSAEGVCMVECLFTKLHIIENGQFNKSGFVITFTPALRGDLKQLSKLREIATICDKEVRATKDREDCDTTKIVLDCFGRNKDKLQLSKTS